MVRGAANISTRQSRTTTWPARRPHLHLLRGLHAGCVATRWSFVILRYAKMKTITNIYILNLAIADELLHAGSALPGHAGGSGPLALWQGALSGRVAS